MTLKELIKSLPISAAALAATMGVKPQSLTPYIRGSRNVKSKLISDLLIVAEANREEIFFKDAFSDAVGDDREHACYWISLALESLSQAAQRGADVEAIKEALIETGLELLPDISPEDFRTEEN